jgi:hypothetical protein
MSHASFKICQTIATANVVDISFLGIDICRTFLGYKYTIVIFISPILLVASRCCSNPRFAAYRVGYGLCDKRANRE